VVGVVEWAAPDLPVVVVERGLVVAWALFFFDEPRVVDVDFEAGGGDVERDLLLGVLFVVAGLVVDVALVLTVVVRDLVVVVVDATCVLGLDAVAGGARLALALR
jgi:hypothetical protein